MSDSVEMSETSGGGFDRIHEFLQTKYISVEN